MVRYKKKKKNFLNLLVESKLKISFLLVPEPTFVSMAQMQESKESESGDDDKVYLFFSETAVECDCYNKLVVSRVARVCKVIKGFTLHALPMTMAHKWHFLHLCSCSPFRCFVAMCIFPPVMNFCVHRGILAV